MNRWLARGPGSQTPAPHTTQNRPRGDFDVEPNHTTERGQSATKARRGVPREKRKMR